jgi:hypothetical protein
MTHKFWNSGIYKKYETQQIITKRHMYIPIEIKSAPPLLCKALHCIWEEMPRRDIFLTSKL